MKKYAEHSSCLNRQSTKRTCIVSTRYFRENYFEAELIFYMKDQDRACLSCIQIPPIATTPDRDTEELMKAGSSTTSRLQDQVVCMVLRTATGGLDI